MWANHRGKVLRGKKKNKKFKPKIGTDLYFKNPEGEIWGAELGQIFLFFPNLKGRFI